MSARITIPDDVKAQVVARVRDALDSAGYFSQALTDNSQLFDSMTANPMIGGVLGQYMKKEKVRTYIKDGIIGKYAKLKNEEILSTDKVKRDLERCEGSAITIIQDKAQVIVGVNDSDGSVVYAAKGTVLKWESALRKVLEKRAAAPDKEGMIVKMYLLLSNTGRKLTEAEQLSIHKTLAVVGVKVILIRS